MRRPAMSRHTSLFSLRDSVPIQLSPPRSPSFHPHAFVSEIRSVLGGCSRFRRCCYLISVLSSHRFCGSRAPGLSRSHLDSAVELSCAESKLSRPRRASLFGYCAMVRTPLRLPTTDVATPPTFGVHSEEIVANEARKIVKALVDDIVGSREMVTDNKLAFLEKRLEDTAE